MNWLPKVKLLTLMTLKMCVAYAMARQITLDLCIMMIMIGRQPHFHEDFLARIGRYTNKPNICVPNTLMQPPIRARKIKVYALS